LTGVRDRLRIGQFSESPVLAIADALGLGEKYGLEWTTQRVPSSPAQFKSLVSNEIDIAITSPDNVLLYTSTADNPLGQKLNLRLLRAIDRGLGLALYTRNEHDPSALRGEQLGVDVPNSGFAFLLFALAGRLGLSREDYEVSSIGATPRRLDALISGEISATILNAETALEAERQGLQRRATSHDMSPDYLGTVLVEAVPGNDDVSARLVAMWNEAVDFILSSEPGEVEKLLALQFPSLAESSYVSLLQSSIFGLIREPIVREMQLNTLLEIREEVGAYVPSREALLELVANQYSS
jgi:ABC-type nitrate/sulfonate/bicarbonate transport system substrate-binding protein